MAKSALTKRVLIDKANTQVVIFTSVAAFILVFSLVACKTLISQATYQNRVIGAKNTAVQQLEKDVSATGDLTKAYKAFVNSPSNVISGISDGTGPKDGNNAQIVLDALPSSYDFPALTTSLEKLITAQNLTINSITGTDDEVAQSGNTTSGAPQSVAMPFEINVTGDYAAIQALIGEFEHSIRPFQVQTVSFSGDQNKLTADITAQTFYQPAKAFKLNSTVVK